MTEWMTGYTVADTRSRIRIGRVYGVPRTESRIDDVTNSAIEVRVEPNRTDRRRIGPRLLVSWDRGIPTGTLPLLKSRADGQVTTGILGKQRIETCGALI